MHEHYKFRKYTVFPSATHLQEKKNCIRGYQSKYFLQSRKRHLSSSLNTIQQAKNNNINIYKYINWYINR